jgi:hypothetical protein
MNDWMWLLFVYSVAFGFILGGSLAMGNNLTKFLRYWCISGNVSMYGLHQVRYLLFTSYEGVQTPPFS